ncbi:MAG: response regulator [Candidatus Sericytochromatia bacterium]
MTKVLIAEDSTIIQRLLSDVLKKDKTIEVVGIAGDGLDAVEKTKSLNPDIILMDYRMHAQTKCASCHKTNYEFQPKTHYGYHFC